MSKHQEQQIAGLERHLMCLDQVKALASIDDEDYAAFMRVCKRISQQIRHIITQLED